MFVCLFSFSLRFDRLQWLFHKNFGHFATIHRWQSDDNLVFIGTKWVKISSKIAVEVKNARDSLEKNIYKFNNKLFLIIVLISF